MAIRKFIPSLIWERNERKWADGNRSLNIQREDYQRLLYDRALELGVNVKFGCKVDNIDQAAPSITLADGEVLSADLIIGADGQSRSSPPTNQI